jgi:hypothetical protein
MSNDFPLEATSMTTWSRLEAGWLVRRDFRCLKQTGTTVISPASEAGGVKGVVVRRTSTSAWVAEARTDPVGEASYAGPGCRREGVLLYRISTTTASGGGPIRVTDSTPADTACGEHTGAPFSPTLGQSHFADGTKFSLDVLGRAGSGFRVRIQLPPPCRVPRLTGRSLVQAKRLLRGARCRLGQVRRPHGRRRGLVVVDQRPRARSIEYTGTPVRVRLGKRRH